MINIWIIKIEIEKEQPPLTMINVTIFSEAQNDIHIAGNKKQLKKYLLIKDSGKVFESKTGVVKKKYDNKMKSIDRACILYAFM